MTSVVVRLAASSDIEPAIAVWRASRAARHGGAGVSGEYESRVRGWAQQPDAFLIVADDGGVVVGMGLAMQGLANDGAGPPLPDLCFISMIYVAPDRWGEGLGQQVVDAVLAEARVRGYRRVELWTADDNTRAHRLYEGRGFRRTGREHAFRPGRVEMQYQRTL